MSKVDAALLKKEKGSRYKVESEKENEGMWMISQKPK